MCVCWRGGSGGVGGGDGGGWGGGVDGDDGGSVVGGGGMNVSMACLWNSRRRWDAFYVSR